MATMANCSEEELHVDGKTVADIMAKYTERLKYLEHMKVIELLWNKKVIDHDEYVSIQKPEMDRRLFLQEKLPKKGDTAFQKFLECLIEINQKILAKDMRRGRPDRGGSTRVPVLSNFDLIREINLRLHVSEDLFDGEAFKQLENEKKNLEASNQKMAKDLDERNKELEERTRETEREKQKFEKDLKESKDKVDELQLQLRNSEKKAEDLERQLKKEQNTYRVIERDKRTIEKELQESRDQAAKQMLHMSAVEKKAKELEELVKREQNAYGELERNKRKIEKELKEKLFLDFPRKRRVRKSQVTGDLSPFFLPFGASGGVRHMSSLAVAAFRMQAVQLSLAVYEGASRFSNKCFHEDHVEGRAYLCLPHPHEAAFMERNSMLGCEDVRDNFHALFGSNSLYNELDCLPFAGKTSPPIPDSFHLLQILGMSDAFSRVKTNPAADVEQPDGWEKGGERADKRDILLVLTWHKDRVFKEVALRRFGSAWVDATARRITGKNFARRARGN
ncbi:unnamed protein product [Darwinula stevensoni]|uniref:CARD domain-containing protein n=1 Tax=Darwinula stevensoni TaxID=69355 RepID=A0A7R9ACI9_9CRUS|nr:unnamed protein product [Darwinula stevensoni]CAG0899864.1 unnamed protein product [Darwinula stevensoni]